MPDIYRRSVKASRTPLPLDTAPMEMMERKREQGVEIIRQTTEFWKKQEAKEEKSIKNNVEKTAVQVYKNGYELYGHQPEEYEKFVNEGLKKIYSSLPDSKEKTNAQANVSIAGSGYDARVQKNKMDDNAAVRVAGLKEKTFVEIEAAKSGLSGLFSMQDNNLSPEQKIEQVNSFKDAQIPLMNAYESRFAQDNNGNLIYSAAERATIEDAWTNRGRYALIDYAGDNITKNRKGVVELRNSLIENKQKVQEDYGISDKDFDKTIQDMDKIISQQTTAEDLRKVESIQVVNDAVIKDMEIEPITGEVGNSEYDNIDTLTGFYKQLQASEREGAYSSKTDREKISKNKGVISRAIIKQVEDGVDLKDRRNWMQKFFQKPNVGEVAVMHVNKNIDELERTSMYQGLSKDEKDNIKANMYIEVLGGLQEAEGISLQEKDNAQGLEIAKKIATGAYYSQIEGMIGSKPYVKNPDDPEDVRQSYQNALYQYNNKASLEAIKQQLGVK